MASNVYDEEQRQLDLAATVSSTLARAGPTTNWLSMIGAGLQSFPLQINPIAFPFLTQLYLGHNAIKSIPEELFEIQSLRGLFLQNNLLERLSPRVSNLTSLQELYLSSNQLTCVPASISHLSQLDCLWLDGNISLPSKISLNISRNRDRVQKLVSVICDLYGNRQKNCSRALYLILLMASLPESLWSTLPKEIVYSILMLLFKSRYDDCWGL